MLQRQRFITSLVMVLAIITVSCMALPVAAASFAGAAPVSDAQLARLRGGFAIGNGQVQLLFGIQRLSFIDGELAAVTTVGSAAGNGLHIIQSGAANFVTPQLRSALPVGTLTTVIQNSLDGRTISNLNVFDITVISAQAAQTLSVHSAILNALAQAM